MKTHLKGWIITALLSIAAPASAAPSGTIWNGDHSPELPLRYVEMTPVLRIAPQIANAEKYASESLYLLLYPSIDPRDERIANINPSITSKTRGLMAQEYRVNLSPYNVQEIEYIDLYEMNSRSVGLFSPPSNQVKVVLPRFGNAYRGSYQPMRFGFGPLGYMTW